MYTLVVHVLGAPAASVLALRQVGKGAGQPAKRKGGLWFVDVQSEAVKQRLLAAHKRFHWSYDGTVVMDRRVAQVSAGSLDEDALSKAVVRNAMSIEMANVTRDHGSM